MFIKRQYYCKIMQVKAWEEILVRHYIRKLHSYVTDFYKINNRRDKILMDQNPGLALCNRTIQNNNKHEMNSN